MGDQTSRMAAGTETILVVDDDQSMLSLCSRKLRAEGFTVLEAAGSSEALKLCAEHKGEIHLLLADLLLPPPALQLAGTRNQFPRTHGQDLVRHVLSIKPHTRVLLISAYTDDELKEQGIQKDGLPFLQKPFAPDALIQRVRETLAGPPVSLPSRKDDHEGNDVEWFD